MTHQEEILHLSEQIEIGAAITFSKEDAAAMGVFWSHLSHRFQSLRSKGVGKSLLAVGSLAHSIQDLCKKYPSFHSPAAEKHADFLLKTVSGVIQSYLAFLYKNHAHETDSEAQTWREWCSRHQARIEKMTQEGAKACWSDSSQSVREQDQKAHRRVLRWIHDLTQKIQDQKKEADRLLALQNESKAHLKKFINFTVFRVAGRRFAIPDHWVKGSGTVQSFSWLAKEVTFQGQILSLRDARKALGFAGEAGGIFIVFQIKGGAPQAWVVDGVEPQKVQYKFQVQTQTQTQDRFLKRESAPIYLLDMDSMEKGQFRATKNLGATKNLIFLP